VELNHNLTIKKQKEIAPKFKRLGSQYPFQRFDVLCEDPYEPLQLAVWQEMDVDGREHTH